MTKKKTAKTAKPKATKAPKAPKEKKENMIAEDTKITALEQEVEALKKKADENMDLAMRAQAEIENARRRAERDVASAHKFGTEKMVNALLPIFDSLDHALLLVKNGQGNLESLVEGTELTVKMFADTLNKFNVTVIDPINQKFDPSQHEAISMVKDGKNPANTIINVVQKGYILNERVIRPARVVVATQ